MVALTDKLVSLRYLLEKVARKRLFLYNRNDIDLDERGELDV